MVVIMNLMGSIIGIVSFLILAGTSTFAVAKNYDNGEKRRVIIWGAIFGFTMLIAGFFVGLLVCGLRMT